MKLRRAKTPFARIETSDGQQYWAIPVPRWWLNLFGWGYIRGSLVRRFIEQRRRRKIAVEIGRKLDVMAAADRIYRHPDETDADFRKRILGLTEHS